MKPVHLHRDGFTLLELILSLAMIATIGVALYSSMSIAFKGRASAANQVEAMRQASIVMDLLRQDLESVLPPTGTLAGPFIGQAGGAPGAELDMLEFHALGRNPAAEVDDPLADGARRIAFELRTDVSPPALVRTVEANLLSPVEREPEEEVLAVGVRALAFRYFDGETWLTEWDSDLDGGVLPRAVEVTITFDAPSPTDLSRPYRVMQLIPLSAADEPAEEGTDG